MEGKYVTIFERARDFLDTRDNELHTRISYSFAKKLLASEGGDEAVVLPAVILHDVGWKSVPEDKHIGAFGPGDIDMSINRVHEVEGAKTARRILEEVGYDRELVDEVVEIVSGHDSRRNALSLNDAIVKDSDKLWRFSPEALVVDPKRFDIDPPVYAEWLRQQIEHWFFTETAKKLARKEYRQRARTLGIAVAKGDDQEG